jgi:CHAT domain-containing protein/tetratricopeptide (TPR) repeat protein
LGRTENVMGKIFGKTIVGLCFFCFCASVSNAQCISDDSIRRQINIIKNDNGDFSSKISKLTALRVSYLKCKRKEGSAFAEIMHRLGEFYFKSGNQLQGVAYTAAAVNINLRTGVKEPFLCNSYYNLGVFYLQLNFIHQSNECYNSSIAAGRNFPDKYFIVGKAHTQLAYSFFKAGDYQHAREMASKGMFFSKAANDTVELGALWAQKGQAETQLGYFKEAYESISMSLSLLTGKENAQLASAYSIYADFLNTTGKYQTSVVYYKRAYLLNKSIQNFTQCANDLNDLGNVYDNNLAQQNNARKYYNMGLQLASSAQNRYQMAGLYENIGVTYWRQHDFKKALTFYQRGLNVLPINFKDPAIDVNPSFAALSQVANDYYVSTLLADKAESLLALYKKNLDKSLLKAALQTFLLADRSVDMMRWKQFGELSKLLWRSQTKEMYANAIAVCYLLDDTEKAFYFFEKSRSVLLNDQLNFTLNAHIPPNENLKAKLQAKMQNLNQRLIALDGKNVDDRSLKTSWMLVHQEWEDQQNKLKAKQSESPILSDNSFEYLKTVKKQLLNNNQSLVEYFNTDSVVYALLITPAKAQIYKISYSAYLHDSGELLRYCSNAGLLNQHYEQYVKLANTLYQKLFKILAINTPRVIISPGDHFISFDALLYDQHIDDSFLVKKYAFSYVYSMRVLMNHAAGNASPKIAFLGVAPENYPKAMRLPLLIGSIVSLQHIGAQFSSSLLLQGESAQKSRLLALLPQSQVIQIYSHAAADSNTRDPVLYMADSAVMMSDIQKLHCQGTNMVVLSACNTGVGYRAAGEGLFSLARGFRLAGIPCTVTNLWQADNQATYELTESFYKYLRAGQPKDESLRLAKLDFIKKDQAHLLPYYWGATIILGDSSPLHIPLTPHSGRTWLLISLACAMLVICYLYFLVLRKNKL